MCFILINSVLLNLLLVWILKDQHQDILTITLHCTAIQVTDSVPDLEYITI